MSLFKTKTDRQLDDAISKTLDELKNEVVGSDEHTKILSALDQLYKARSYNTNDRVSMDTVLTISANLLGIVTILSFERSHVIASKALSFIVKARP